MELNEGFVTMYSSKMKLTVVQHGCPDRRSGFGPVRSVVRNSGPIQFRSGPVVRNSGPSYNGPVRWSGIPDQLILVRSGGPESRTKLNWSGPVVLNSGPDQAGPDFWSGKPNFCWSGPEIFVILKLTKNKNPCFS